MNQYYPKQLKNNIEQNLGSKIIKTSPLNTGFGISGLKVTLKNGLIIAIKASPEKPSEEFNCEADMLNTLKSNGWPVPKVLFHDNQCLAMEYLSNDNSALTTKAEFQCGQLLAKRHQEKAPLFGYETTTPIGRLAQNNNYQDKWIPFFQTNRIEHMAQAAQNKGHLQGSLLRRLMSFNENLENFLEEPQFPTLIHGDLWGGNVIINKGRLQGFIDPAIYYAHPEIELAFTQMFNTFGRDFFKGYQSISKISDGFFEQRLAIYNLYPTLVHVVLFGRSYLPPIEQTLKRFGF